MDLAEKIYFLTQTFPSSELYALTSQLKRSAVSIPSNIAEGHTREHTKEYLYHLSVAQASLAELQTQVELAFRLKFLDFDRAKELHEQSIALTKQLYALRNALTKKG